MFKRSTMATHASIPSIEGQGAEIDGSQASQITNGQQQASSPPLNTHTCTHKYIHTKTHIHMQGTGALLSGRDMLSNLDMEHDN